VEEAPATSVTLGGKQFPIKPITLGQMKRIGIGGSRIQQLAMIGKPGIDGNLVEVPDTLKREENFYSGSIEVLSGGLGLDVAAVEAIEGVTLAELLVATKTIFTLCGLITAPTPDGNKIVGEGTGA
jgi:hypothetical protein